VREQACNGLFVIPKEALGALAKRLAGSYAILAPVDEGGVAKDAEIDGQLPETMPLTKRPLKEAFFPQEEVLFTFGSGGEVEMPRLSGGPTRVAFGVRPCDARGLTLLDHVFASDDYKDPYYVSRRQGTAIFTFACLEPGVACFCTALGGGPFDETGSDALFVDLGESYLVKVLSEKGQGVLEDALRGLPGVRDAKSGDLDGAREAEARSRAEIDAGIPVKAATEKLARAFDDPAWEEVYRKCLGCAACTYLCPTCHCFDIGDEVMNASGERVRNWDSCMFPLFTRHASGHNPRPSRKERFRQRIMHKFNYFVENNGCVACVGCGRCVENCPVNLDVRQVLKVFAGV